MNKLSALAPLRPYLAEKRRELDARGPAEDETNAQSARRRLSNIGCFRAYVTAYLRAHPELRHDLDMYVRQREATDKGLPLELYVFSSDTQSAAYHSIQSDIFDHLLTVVPEFDLRVFQSPTGHDLRQLSPSRES
jgi:miniconductance mechanosensitive channel